ncbi:MAG: PhnD/SsuA/transferrin family substrate-binding protein [Rhodocyclales bacterium]|nr:PhnD/SsuA/transferrin family substrate-binding protein [Rhodocyclales bacterium]
MLSLWSIMPAAAANGGEVKMFVTAAFVSESGLPVYREIADYIAAKIGRKTAIVAGASYAEADMMVERGIVHVGFVCGLPYVHSFLQGKYSLLAIPVSATRTGQLPDASAGYEKTPGKYYSYTIVHKDSKVRSWADLKGKRYAFNDVNSNSGYNMPRYKLVQLGAKSWNDWFSKVIVSGSHEESIRMVARGVVDASSVDSLVLDYDRINGNPDAGNVRIIEQLFPGGAGAPPVVVGNRIDPALRQAVQAALLNMHKDEAGRQILAKALLLRFDPPDDRNYDDIRRMDNAARSAGFRDHDER